MNQKYDKLKALLKELFQLDQPDLDFGLYRVMHAKSAEVSQFLDNDLLPQVQTALGQYRTAHKEELKKALSTMIAGVEAAAMNPDDSSEVQKLRARLKSDAIDMGAREGEVYDHLFSFFRRYYSEGDFLAKPVYKPGVYAIPYEGEEVMLHWANKDQYYIKTSEYLRNYSFRLRPHDEQKPLRVHFRLVDAVEGEHGNVKAAEGKNRLFVLRPPRESTYDFVAEEDGRQGKELVIHFEYRPATLTDWPEENLDGKKKPPIQKDLSALAVKNVLAVADPALAEWIAELGKPHIMANGEPADYCRLEAHLKRYTARNTFDYFIHKDLGAFLRRELDFYIKNEVIHLDDVENESAPRVEQYLSKIKIIRKIAGKIIDFLAQLEDFQRRLWLKKKFVIESSYRITLDRIPTELYPEIAACDEQRNQWVHHFAIDKSDGYTKPLNIDFLSANQSLILDSTLFPPSVTEKILNHQRDYFNSVNGILIHGDNLHALNLIGRAMEGKVRCIYIDPPYNTAVSSIPYKNNYKHSTFATMIRDRAALMRSLLEASGILYVSIDKHERTTVELTLDTVFGRDNRIEELIWVQNTNDGRSPTYSVNHEYVEVYARHRPTAEADVRIFRDAKPGCAEALGLVREINGHYPTIINIQSALAVFYRQHQLEYRKAVEAEGLDWKTERRNDPWKGVYMYKFAEYRDELGRYVEEDQARKLSARIWVYRESDWTIMSSERKQSPTILDPQHPNFRFYKPKHPITGKTCAMPSRGWKGTRYVDPEHPERNSWESLVADHRIAFGFDETKVPQQKRFLHEVETNVAKSVFVDYADGEKETTDLFGRTGVFLAPKHTHFVRRFLGQVIEPSSVVLDCFGGSGSTAHAVIATNRDEEKCLKYILVEVGDYGSVRNSVFGPP